MLNPKVPQTQDTQPPMQMQQQAPEQQDDSGIPQDPNMAQDPMLDQQNKTASIHTALEQRLNSLPKEQQAFVNHFLCPETAILMGIVGGVEAYDYFKQYTDPSKMAVIVPRSSQPQGDQSLQEDQQAIDTLSPGNVDTSGDQVQGPAVPTESPQ